METVSSRDAAAVKPHIAKIQNLTIGVSFGAERDASFQHAKNRAVVNVPLPNGTTYGFRNQVNIDWTWNRTITQSNKMIKAELVLSYGLRLIYKIKFISKKCD